MPGGRTPSSLRPEAQTSFESPPVPTERRVPLPVLERQLGLRMHRPWLRHQGLRLRTRTRRTGSYWNGPRTEEEALAPRGWPLEKARRK